MNEHGLLIIDKPPDITSRDVVNRAMRWFPKKTKLGHTGTLDPLATGVLVLCIGSATRLAEYVQNMKKTYRSRFLLGARSDTDDADGTVTALSGVTAPISREVEEALSTFIGEIEQTPPAYSAAKVAGARSYDLARAGKAKDLKPRRVRIDSIQIEEYQYPHLDVTIECGKGTYIRSIARDLGERLGCGGLVATLRRTRVGPFRAEDGLSPDTTADEAKAHLLPLSAAVQELPAILVTEDQAKALAQGQQIVTDPREIQKPTEGAEVAILHAESGELIAVGLMERDGRIRPVKVVG